MVTKLTRIHDGHEGFYKWIFKNFYVAADRSTIELSLRRTLVRSVILLCKFSQMPQISTDFFSVHIREICESTNSSRRNMSYLLEDY